jgi:serine/threonine protein phosphatase 1
MSYGYQQGGLLEPFKGNLRDDLKWLASLPKYFETEKQVFVHAAVTDGVPMEAQSKDVLQWACYDEAYKYWNGEHDPEQQHVDASHHKHVVHGHEQWAKGPILLEGRTDLDTFAWYTGRLAIGVFDDSQGKPIDILWAEGPPHGGN